MRLGTIFFFRKRERKDPEKKRRDSWAFPFMVINLKIVYKWESSKSTQTSTVSNRKEPDLDRNQQCHSKVLCGWKLMIKLPGSDCRKMNDKGMSKLACNWTKACWRRSSHSRLTLSLLFNSGFPWIHALLTCQKVLWVEPLFLLKELGTDRGRFYSIPGCGDTNSDTSFTPTLLRL